MLFTILSALYDNGKRFENHAPRFVFRFLIVALISYFTDTNFILNTSIFYLLFDYLLNILEGRKWNYIGQTAKFDLFFRKIGGWIPQLFFKIIFVIISTFL